MQVTVEPRDNFTILHLRGEFDTFYCALLQKEVDGLIASGVNRVALNLLLILGVMASLGATITLPGLAGIVLTVGMAVDANILIFERMREELAAGRNLMSANADGYRKALTTILDAHLLQLIICGIMIWLGTGPIKGFGVTLLIGVLSTLFSVLITAHLVMELLVDSGTVRSRASSRSTGILPAGHSFRKAARDCSLPRSTTTDVNGVPFS